MSKVVFNVSSIVLFVVTSSKIVGIPCTVKARTRDERYGYYYDYKLKCIQLCRISLYLRHVIDTPIPTSSTWLYINLVWILFILLLLLGGLYKTVSDYYDTVRSRKRDSCACGGHTHISPTQSRGVCTTRENHPNLQRQTDSMQFFIVPFDLYLAWNIQ